jgi:hypothetical protein
LALAQLGSAGSLDEVLFVTRLAILAKEWAHAGGWAARGAATRCARAAAYAADAAAAYAAYAAYYADAARAATYATYATYAADAADDATRADAAAHAARNKSLANAAEDVVQLLIEMNAPGARWLALAPLNS